MKGVFILKQFTEGKFKVLKFTMIDLPLSLQIGKTEKVSIVKTELHHNKQVKALIVETICKKMGIFFVFLFCQ